MDISCHELRRVEMCGLVQIFLSPRKENWSNREAYPFRYVPPRI